MVFSCVIGRQPRELGSSPAPRAVNPVLLWAEYTLEAFQADGLVSPTVATRIMAMESIAVLDVINAIHGAPGFLGSREAPAGVSEAAAVASAAAQVLVYALPGQTALIDGDLKRSLAGVPDGEAEDSGVAFGRTIAADLVQTRAADGWDAVASFPDAGGEAGLWRPTLPEKAAPVTPQWDEVTPFMMVQGDQFRPSGPASLNSPQYAVALNEVKALRGTESAERTADETALARFWANDSGTYTAPGHLNHIAVAIAVEEGLDPAHAAQLFAELDVAMADAAIAHGTPRKPMISGVRLTQSDSRTRMAMDRRPPNRTGRLS